MTGPGAVRIDPPRRRRTRERMIVLSALALGAIVSMIAAPPRDEPGCPIVRRPPPRPLVMPVFDDVRLPTQPHCALPEKTEAPDDPVVRV